MDEETRHVIEGLFASGHKLVYEFAGAGSLALTWLHSVGGSSRLILEATDRYSAASLADLLGREVEKPVSAETARAMAERAYRRAVRLSDGTSPCIGLACTATIATDRTKRGEHACHIAVQDRGGCTVASLVLAKGERDRSEEETVVADLALMFLAPACGVFDMPPYFGLIEGEEIVEARHDAPDAVHLLCEGSVRSVSIHPGGRRSPDESFAGALLSGSFNPLHCGHESMLRAAGTFLNLPIAYELPILNADKPPLAANEIERRVGQFRRYPVILTRVPLFGEKAELFPGCAFVIGYDTAVRLVDPRYYAGAAGLAAALSAVRARGCRFLVAARPMPGQGVRTLADVTLPQGFEDLFIELPRSAFLLDLSSTELRGSV